MTFNHRALHRFMMIAVVSLVAACGTAATVSADQAGAAKDFNLGEAFFKAYLPNATIPMRPTELPVRRWAGPVSVFFDMRQLSADRRPQAQATLEHIVDFVRAHTNLVITEVATEADANASIAFANPGRVGQAIPESRLLSKYYESWIGTFAADVEDFKKVTCVAHSNANRAGQIETAVVLIQADLGERESDPCIIRGFIHALGFDGFLPKAMGVSIFSEDPALVTPGPHDGDILHLLYGDKVPGADMSLAKFIMQVDPLPAVYP